MDDIELLRGIREQAHVQLDEVIDYIYSYALVKGRKSGLEEGQKLGELLEKDKKRNVPES